MTDGTIAVSKQAEQWASLAHRLWLDETATAQPKGSSGLVFHAAEPDTPPTAPAMSPARVMGLTLAPILSLDEMIDIAAALSAIDIRAARWLEQQWHAIEMKDGLVWMA